LLYLSNGRHDDSSNLSVCEFRTDSISTLLGDAHSFVIKSEAYQILTLEAVSELTCFCPHRYQGGSKIIFFVSELKSNSVSNSKTKGTPYRCSAASLHVHSKTKQAGAEHPAVASVSKRKKEKNYLLTLPLPASINGTATHACVVRNFNLVRLSYMHTPEATKDSPSSLLHASGRHSTRHSATGSTSTSPCAATTRLRLHVLYLNLAVRCDYSAPAAQALRQPRRVP
jgi:hypothetical protein